MNSWVITFSGAKPCVFGIKWLPWSPEYPHRVFVCALAGLNVNKKAGELVARAPLWANMRCRPVACSIEEAGKMCTRL